MTLANPSIVDATSWYNPSDNLYHTVVLWKNSGGYGYMSFEGYSPSYTYFRRDMCDGIKLQLAGYFEMSTNMVLPYELDFRAFKCNGDSQQNCNTIMCSQRVLTSSFYGVPVRAKDTTLPSTPSGLIVTPGDRQLTISWNTVINTYIFSYYVKLSHGSIIDTEGFLPNNIKNITLSNLVNGTSYTAEVTAYNYSFLKGTTASKIGTPTAPCIVPTCNFTVS